MSGDKEYSFGPFRFIPTQQILLRGDIPLRVGSRALDILQVLIESEGELVSKSELLKRVWPRTVVEESNLKVNVAALRRALGEQKDDNNYIVTITGRGYRFAAAVSTAAVAQPLPALSGPKLALTLPASATRMIGRRETVASLLQTLGHNRLVSLVGPGGIGKTTVALSVAEQFSRQTGCDVRFVDFTPLSDGRFVSGAVAAALGLTVHSGDGTPAVLADLRGRDMLLLLDGCEHVIETVAVLANRIVGAAPNVRLLATSREPLRTAGEHVHRIAPLVYPSERPGIDAAEAQEFAAIQLFVERASESTGGYQLSDADASAVAEICRRLEGNALAIELAATRVEAFGARELADRLDDRFRLLKRGRRTAQERHSSLTAALDWSYDYLPAFERELLRSLAIFAGSFTLDAAVALCASSPAAEDDVIEGVSSLVAKSLITADVGGPLVYYRLLDTTKAYALDKLDELGEMDAMLSRHAECLSAMFEQAISEWDEHPTEAWLARHVRRLDDVRNALTWAFSPGGQAPIGVSLTVAAIPLWMHLTLLDECFESVQRALASGLATPSQEMKLQAAVAGTLLYARGPVDLTEIAWSRSLELADYLGDSEFQLRALWGLAVYQCYSGDHRAVNALAERFRAIAESRGDREALVSIERLVGTALHYGGEQTAARLALESMLARHVSPPPHCIYLARHQLDQRSTALGTLANVLWLQGYPHQAMQTAHAAAQAAKEAEHMPSLLNTLALSVLPVMMNIGDRTAAAKLLNELSEHLSRLALPTWNIQLRGLHAMLQVENGDLSALSLLHDALDALHAEGYHLRYNSYLGTLASALGKTGRHKEGLEIIAQALACCEAGKEHWSLPELLRIKGTLLETSDPEAAQTLYLRALDIARQQAALSWELRAASSLAQLGAHDGATLLQTVYSKFTEGFDTLDLRRAKALLNQASAG
jgi:predicted ATPase/DNA-binding winged helix-turn-helix (wHTH) protein